jgi:hypothetical protein
MDATTLNRMPPRSGPVQVGLVASLLVVAAGAWAVTGDRMGVLRRVSEGNVEIVRRVMEAWNRGLSSDSSCT